MAHYECSVCGDYLCNDEKCADIKYNRFHDKQNKMTIPPKDPIDNAQPVDDSIYVVVLKNTNVAGSSSYEFSSEKELKDWITKSYLLRLNDMKIYHAKKVNLELKLELS